MPERRIFSLGALLGWVVRDSVFLVVLILVVGRGDATRRDPSHASSGETNDHYMPAEARRDPSYASSGETNGHYMPARGRRSLWDHLGVTSGHFGITLGSPPVNFIKVDKISSNPTLLIPFDAE